MLVHRLAATLAAMTLPEAMAISPLHSVAGLIADRTALVTTPVSRSRSHHVLRARPQSCDNDGAFSALYETEGTAAAWRHTLEDDARPPGTEKLHA